MEWRRLNGQKIEQHLLTAVEDTIRREIAQGFKLKVCIGTDSQVIGTEVHLVTLDVVLGEKRVVLMMKCEVSNHRKSRMSW